MSRIILFLGSTRDGRNGERVAKHLVKLLEEKKHTVSVFGEHSFNKGRAQLRLFDVVVVSNDFCKRT